MQEGGAGPGPGARDDVQSLLSRLLGEEEQHATAVAHEARLDPDPDPDPGGAAGRGVSEGQAGGEGAGGGAGWAPPLLPDVR